jgi:hypothetical protein
MSRPSEAAVEQVRPARLVRLVVALVLAGSGGLLAPIASGEANAAQRATCSRALQACGKPRVCQSRYQACLETGCWTVWRVRRCGYERR